MGGCFSGAKENAHALEHMHPRPAFKARVTGTPPHPNVPTSTRAESYFPNQLLFHGEITETAALRQLHQKKRKSHLAAGTLLFIRAPTAKIATIIVQLATFKCMHANLEPLQHELNRYNITSQAGKIPVLRGPRCFQ